MSQVLDDLLSLLKLETIEQGIYRGQSQDLGFKALFGGQVMGQALSAAQETVEKDRQVHSLHSYFLRAGDASKPVVYEVEVLRDGRSFSARRIQAIQNGQAIFYMTASFQAPDQGFEHQDAMPDVPGPDEISSYQDYIVENQHVLTDKIRAKFLAEKPITLKPVEKYNWIEPEKMPAKCHMWIKANGDLPDDLRVHKYMLAYTSDFQFLPTALFPHGVSHWRPDMQLATIDHTMWFHRSFRFDDWLLYAIDSPTATSGRGLVRGQIFNRQGELVASTMQEGVMRFRKAPNT
ncbi:MAG: acyl-CoA thioesterase II [Thalassotalea sp.]|nr:acyl-CoA thioesterase II [Thalassotalea sp.]